VFFVETFAKSFADDPGHMTAPVVSVQPLLKRPRNSPHLTVFVGFAALSSDMALFFPLTDSDQSVSAAWPKERKLLRSGASRSPTLSQALSPASAAGCASGACSFREQHIRPSEYVYGLKLALDRVC
jgi:hypothetical protein